MGTEYQVKKKSHKGMIAGIIILVLILGVGGYGYFWFTGLNTMPDELKNSDTAPTAQMVSFYDNNVLQKSTNPIVMDSTQSKYVFTRLYNETNFFHLAAGTPVKINKFLMYPDANNMHLAMAITVSDTQTSLLTDPKEIIFGTQKVNAASPFTFLNDKQYGITATLSMKTFPEGIGMKPISVSVGNSPMPVGIAMGLAKQYAPSMQVTADGYIIIKPTQIIDANTKKVIGMFTGLEVKDGQAYLTIVK